MRDLAIRQQRQTTVVLRWLVSFLGFPLGGFLADLLFGPVDGPLPAVLGGLITGAVLGAAQAWALGRNRPSPVAWIVATALGLAVGLSIGAAAVGYESTLTALAIQGVISGAAVGAAQAVLLWPRLGRLALLWPVALAASWALGWMITTSIGVLVNEQFTVFGSSGAIVVTALTAVLPLALNRAAAAQASRA
ncbi:hypothetical protein DFJ67_4951 [Asanoa ferruginea]|uniref:Uncharacterized protein n=1 Tax=Asanoa ferruginea TaxID=53367 RepID=A0A3D9ZNI0_9ACTN|nr:hypothetical protein [Asanoa ferruginea]REF98926.1 hypothetical protein DFJ67_4951 [Asanoa ferruginea]GIF46392.1 hypothetical protein Afe04nite_09310 [Asanoa ferruginea]